MKTIKNKVSLLIYTLIVAVFFSLGYVSGVINGKNRVKETIAAATDTPEAVDASVKEEREIPEYELILEDSHLTIYEKHNGEKNIIALCEISESVYPSEDVTALRKGMIFAEKTDAMAMFENFAS